MKKLSIVVCAIAAILATACQKQGGELQFKTVKYHDSITSPTITYLYDAEMELPAEGLTADIRRNLRDNIIIYCLGDNYVDINDKRVLRVYSDSSYAEYTRLFQSDLESIDEDIEFNINCETKIRGAVSFERDSLLNYENRMYVYSGGAHGMSRTSNYIFDLKTGEIITEADIFGDNTDEALHNMLVMEAAKLRNDSILPADTEFFGDDLIVPNGNVELGENGLSYVFNPYEIAPYVYGTISIPLDSRQVLPLLNTASPVHGYIARLADQIQ